MELRPENRDQIETYLSGNMSPQEKEAFEARVAAEPDLAEELRHLAGQKELFRVGRRLDMMRRLEGMEAAIVARKKRNRRLLAVAATLILLAVAGRFLYTPVPTGQDMYQEYFEPYLLGGPQRDNSPPTAYDTAWENYRRGNYAQALTFFDTVSSSHPDFQVIQLYRGISTLDEGACERAIAQFQTIIDTEGHPYTEEALYYQGLAHLRLGRDEAAIRVFKEFQNQNAQYHKADVEQILKTIHENRR